MAEPVEKADSAAGEKPLKLSSSVRQIKGVGARRAEQLNRLGIRTLSDLLRHLPMRYERESAEGSLADLPVDGIGTIRGIIVATRWIPAGGHGGKGRFQATLERHDGRIALTWFNAAYLRDKLLPGMSVRVSGKTSVFNGYPQMVGPRWEPLPPMDGSENGAGPAAKDERLRPIYPATEDLTSLMLEKLIAQALPEMLKLVVDPLPAVLMQRHAMPTLSQAYELAHQPKTDDDYTAARRRLAYNELLLLQLGICIKRHFNDEMLRAPALRWSAAIHEHILSRFPFKLTDAQARVIKEIADDLTLQKPMNRLLQGDVGAGKTIVALYAMLLAAADRKQSALMAPTELLAEQHFASLSKILQGSTIRIALLTGSQPPANSSDRKKLFEQIEQGEIDLLIGTHALLGESVRFNSLAVVVIDEQHRFGVLQRASFRGRMTRGNDKENGKENAFEKTKQSAKKNENKNADEKISSPHYLVMTATPIPRTLSLTLFGDLDVSVIDALPPGRSPIITRVVGPEKVDEVYRFTAQRVASCEQAYVVVPAIDGERTDDLVLKNVIEHARDLQDKYFSQYKVGMVHGRLSGEEREAVMDEFRKGKIHVLVATTVIEVGVDVPNATVMIIEHAERFGLAQLHQLRGRIGRGTHTRSSVCVLIGQGNTPESQQRLEAIAKTNDGFAIAEMDLEIRGMGEFFGTKQSGMPPLKVARIPEDLPLLNLAKKDAVAMVQADPKLSLPSHHLLARVLSQQYGTMLGLIDVG